MGLSELSINQFIEETRWTPKNGLDSAANYSGEDLSTWCKGPGQSRDSEILEQSNFDVALERLGGEHEGIVEVHRFGHWACGWFEHIMVNPKYLDKIKILREIASDLERYPVLDDFDYSDREWEYMSDYANGAKAELAKALALHFGLDIHERGIRKALENIAYGLNIECQAYYGTDACVDVYTCREPDERDLDRLQECLSRCDFINNLHSGPHSLEVALAEYLTACFGGDK